MTVVDVAGEQVADFFAETRDNPQEFLSPAVTIDCHESLRLAVGDTVYSNRYRPMFRLVADEVGTHDLLFPCCRPEMYDFFYNNGDGHTNCYNNINQALEEKRSIIQPINLFMNTKITPEGKITILPPLSKAGDRVVFQALMDVRIGIAACSVSEGVCNSRQCSGIKVMVGQSLRREGC